MKLCICGKGGSGKSTLAAMMAKHLQQKGRKVLVVDADESNTCLYRLLGLAQPPISLMAYAGGKKTVQGKMMARFAAGEKEAVMSILDQDAIFSEQLPDGYVAGEGGCRLVCIGKIQEAMEGCACPMGAVGREFLNKLHLQADEVVIVDMEAGIEHFGRGIETGADKVLFVLDPSLESIELAERVKALTASSGAGFAGAVLNKVHGEPVRMGLVDALSQRGVPVIGSIAYHDEIQAVGLEGGAVDTEIAASEMAAIVERVMVLPS